MTDNETSPDTKNGKKITAAGRDATQPPLGRRTALKSLVGAAASISLFSEAVSARTQRQQRKAEDALGEQVALGKAEQVAETARVTYANRNFSSWVNASLGNPKKYYTNVKLNTRQKHLQTAYVFPVEYRSESVGYLTISARKSWSPVLEASTANPPTTSKQQVRRIAHQQGDEATKKLRYRGAATYSVELESGAVIYLNNGLSETITPDAPQLEVERHSGMVDSQWSTATDVRTNPVQAQGGVQFLSVDPWDANGGSGSLSGSDGGNANTSKPGLYGSTADPWDTWDGCAPFAGAQILMFHEGIFVSNIEKREEIADRLHLLMDTDSQGWTDYLMPRVGITDYPASETQHNYTGYEEVFLSKGLFRGEIDSGRPFIIPGGDKTVKGKGPYSGHSIVVFGYDDSNGFDVAHYNSWDENWHWMQYGNWPFNTWVTRVVP